ncbi:MAG: polysaccharide deacetylase family protein [Candidatus Hydrogenedentes bacterium]|nr:polysaccharide deacetylase family protein [Candidatus Hydrogenedentota bacterium]
MKSAFLCLMMAALSLPLVAGAEPTFGERLGWKVTDRVLIVHNDDTGMSHEANLGTIEAYEKGVLSSNSVMMPCSWVPEWRDYMLANPELDNGLHLTLTSEWKHYRWRPVAGAASVPGLVDKDGYMHRGVMEVYQHATADEVETEIRAQIELAERMGMPITHLDSHMGTLFYNPGYFERYIKVGIEKQIPIMMISGRGEAENEVQRQMLPRIQAAAKMVWEGGLPVLDYLYTSTADTNDPEEMTEALIKNLRELKPGITQIILHATRHSPNFEAISGSGKKREAELEMVLSPAVKKVIEEEGIILTTYRELMERRKAVK